MYTNQTLYTYCIICAIEFVWLCEHFSALHSHTDFNSNGLFLYLTVHQVSRGVFGYMKLSRGGGFEICPEGDSINACP